MSSLYLEKPELSITFQNLTFIVKSYSCHIEQRTKIYHSMAKAFIQDNQGVPPFELKFKGYFEAHSPLHLPEIYTIIKNNSSNTIIFKGAKFSQSRLTQIQVFEDTSKQFAECEITFLITGTVTSA
jgi:hypothetical protein